MNTIFIALQSEISDLKNPRQSNTSPARSRKSVHESKNSASKNAFKRNLFGDPNSDQSPSVLAKQLSESPLRLQHTVFNDSATHSAKKHVGGKDLKGRSLFLFIYSFNIFPKIAKYSIITSSNFRVKKH